MDTARIGVYVTTGIYTVRETDEDGENERFYCTISLEKSWSEEDAKGDAKEDEESYACMLGMFKTMFAVDTLNGHPKLPHGQSVFIFNKGTYDHAEAKACMEHLVQPLAEKYVALFMGAVGFETLADGIMDSDRLGETIEKHRSTLNG